jgi:signal transduction histidine kinase
LATAEFRERLLGIVGHDLRNPLGAISICAQLLLTEGHGDRDSVVTLVAFLLKSVRRMDRMIKQIFEFTQARLGGGIPLQLSPTSMRPICQHAIEELVLISTVPIKAEYQGDISGNWDDERLMEALSNLIGNAIDHATPGTPVMVRAIRQGSDVTVEVANQGLPIPAELLPVLFVPFHRGRPGINARAGHLGLGLYIAHEITRLHGGTLTVQTSGGTTSLLMRLPRQPPPTDG